MRSIADRIASQRELPLAETATFTEEQNIRRQFGPGVFMELCRAMKVECDHINAGTQLKSVSYEERPPLFCSVTNLATGDILSVAYEALAAAIHCELRGEAHEIVLRVNRHPEPSVCMVLKGTPSRPQEVASILITDLL